MMRFIYRRALATLGMALLLPLMGCNDDLSQIGESIQSDRDVVYSNKHFLEFEATTVSAEGIYTGSSTAGLLGAISDPAYGDFSADFITQVRAARGFSFEHTPIGGQIDSVRLRLIQTGGIGIKTAPLQISVYEVDRGFSGSEYSRASLSEHAKSSALIGERSVVLNRDLTYIKLAASDSVQALTIPLDRQLGQRIYDASRSNADAFATQESFSREVLGGLYVTVSTGSGAIVRIGSVQLLIYYSYTGADGKTKVAAESFINTKLTPHATGITNTHIDGLFTANDKHTYVKGPSGAITQISLSRTQMERLLKGRSQVDIGSSFMLSDAQLKLTVDNPAGLLLNPPKYMMLMPRDSVQTYFKRGMTERTQSATSYLSSDYTTKTPYYNFSNIARLVTEHLLKHAKYTGGNWIVESDLVMQILPVERSVATNNSTTVTTGVEEYLFPYFVRLNKGDGSLKVGVVSVEFK